LNYLGLGERKLLKKTVSGIMLAMLLLIFMLTLAFNIQLIKAEPTTIIVPDDYPTIQEAVNAASPGDIIYVYGPYYYEEEVIVNKSVSLIGRFGPELISIDVVANDVYIQGFGFRTPWGFPYGRAIVLNGVSGCEILKVIVSGIDEGPGIVLTDASNNVIANSWVWGFIWDGAIVFERSSNNTIFGNTIEANYGPSIYLDDSSDNKFFHNQFYVYEARQVEVIGRSKNVWDDGYPSGGNYWSDHNPPDTYSGPYQNESGSDKIGDTSYIIDADNIDRYPLIYPFGYVPSPDLNNDGVIDILDLVTFALAYGSIPGIPIWNPYVDLNQDSTIDIFDLVIIAVNYGKTYP